ncbi:hypothetical protein R1sor_004134 [Riccia sorocarpa]|uniref:Protein ZIP4 homolog n=1 Tax=Riccia sorocarpa TaxID=122646 RepID=A0ABD3H6F5_9MARC
MTPTSLVKTMEKMIGEIEQKSAVSTDLLNRVKKIVEQFPQDPSYHEKLQAWKLSFRIWNTCVDLVNNCSTDDDQEKERGDYAADDEGHAVRRQAASDLLFAAGTIEGVDSCPVKIATFYYKTGTIWHKARNFGQASVCFDKATEIISKGGSPVDKEEQQLLFDLLLARSQTAWELNHRAVVWSLLARARNLLVHFREKISRLAEHYLQHGKELLGQEDDKESQSEAIKYLEHAFEICCEAKGPTEEPGKSSNSLSALKLQILRYLAVGHSQKENHLSVLKCLAVLKLGPSHPSTHYLGVKALVGLGRYEEAEVELFSLIRQNTASVEACLSALELVLQDPSRMDGCKRAFFALQSFHASNKVIPLRMLEYLLKNIPTVSDGSCSSQVKRVEVALEIAVNGNIVSVITDRSPAAAAHSLPLLNVADGLGNKEQVCMHALLWNSGTEHFSAKSYETSIKLFEASMLYLPGDGENNSIAQRAKALRVLCLCHLALCHYDRAAEFADEAHKIEPNIAGRFLKFKILLQTNKEVEAVDVVKDMLNCSDFEPDFLTLASHEAMTQNAARVAAAALSTLLSLQLEKKNTGTKEIILFRNLIHISLRSPDIQKEALYHMKQAQTHLAEVGFELCFGSTGSVAQQECKWFASTAWNQGLQTIKCQDWHLSVEWLACASDFISSLEETQENLIWLQKCLLLAASSSLLVADTGVDCLRQTTKMLEKCTKIQRALAMSMESATAEEHTQLEAQLALLSFEVKGRAKDHKAQLDILYQCGALPEFKADYYLMMANSVRKEAAAEPSCLDVATTAIRLALKFMLSSSSPDYNLVALTLRTQIKLLDQQKKDGPEVLAVYRQVKEIIASLSGGEYPADEAQWLVATSWNRAGLHLKFQRYGEAEAWMEVALDLVKYAPELDLRKAAMLEGLNYVRQKQIRKKSIPSKDV